MTEAEVKIDENIVVFILPKLIDPEWSEIFAARALALVKGNYKLFVYDFKNVRDIRSSALRNLTLFIQHCKQKEIAITSIDLNEAVTQKLTKEGLLSLFKVSKNMDSAKELLPADAKATKLDVKFINPFVNAAIYTIEVQTKTNCQAGKPFLVKVDDKSYSPAIALAGVISIASKQFNGSITLAFPELVFLKIYENMFGEKHDKITPEIEDAAGELLNIIYGAAKTELNQNLGADLKPALPTILAGDSIRIRQKTQELLIILPFITEVGQFQIEVALENMKS